MTSRGERGDAGLHGARLDRMRTRYAPRFRPGGGILGIAPWLDLVLVLIFYLLLETRVTLHAGVVVDLPEAAFTAGVQSGSVALLTVERGVDGALHEVAYVDDLRYVVASDDGVLAVALRDLRGGKDEALVLYADRRVPHATVSDVLEMARIAGFRQVGLATRQPDVGEAVPADREP
jgi:biopolymer transport protein ExbD